MSAISVFRVTAVYADQSLVGGVGSVACQLAKNVYGAARVITTVSTEKVPRVEQTLGEGVVDQGEIVETTVVDGRTI